MSDSLVWHLIRDNNSFLVKRGHKNRQGAVKFSKVRFILAKKLLAAILATPRCYSRNCGCGCGCGWWLPYICCCVSCICAVNVHKFHVVGILYCICGYLHMLFWP